MPLTDTIAHDTVAAAEYPALDTLAIGEWAAEAARARQKEIEDSIASLPPPPPDWQSGLPPRPLPRSAASDSMLSAIIVAMILAVVFSFSHCRRLLKNLGVELWSVRSRSKNFDEHTSNESRLMVLFGIQFCVYGGLLLQGYAALVRGVAPFTSGIGTSLLYMLLAGAWYVFQLLAVKTVCYAFATPEQGYQTMRGLSASQVVTGFLFIIPAVVIFFYPDASLQMLIVAATAYLLMRMIYISKVFRIFYTNYTDLMYFILYLCALEIIPVAIVLALCLYIPV